MVQNGQLKKEGSVWSKKKRNMDCAFNFIQDGFMGSWSSLELEIWMSLMPKRLGGNK
jgi:hypothetical protein